MVNLHELTQNSPIFVPLSNFGFLSFETCLAQKIGQSTQNDAKVTHFCPIFKLWIFEFETWLEQKIGQFARNDAEFTHFCPIFEFET